MSDTTGTLAAHTCCWHVQNTTMYTSFPPLTPEVCCHCGATRTRRPEPPPPPPGHGPYYPQPWTFGTWGTGTITHGNFGCPCRVENGGSGVCNCTLGGPTITYG